MKRKIVLSSLIFTFLLINIPSYGQLYLAPKIGMNGITSFDKNDGLSFNFEKGYQFGIEAGNTFYNLVGLKAELMYANKAFSLTAEKVQNEDSGESNLFTEKLNIKNGTLQINGALQIILSDKFELSVGPQMELLMSSSGNGTINPTNATDSVSIVDYDFINDSKGEGAYWNNDEKEGNFFNSAVFGINMGINIKVFPKFHIDIRTNYSFSRLINDYYVSDPAAFKTSNIELIFTASYRIPVKKRKHKNEEEAIELPIEEESKEKPSDNLK